MAELGNIFQGMEGEGARGDDLYVDVSVSSRALGMASGAAVRVPLVIDGVRRADPHGDGEKLRLHLPTGMQTGQTLRMRGLGGELKQGRPGDLYVTVTVRHSPGLGIRVWLAIAGTALAALFTWALLR